MRNTVNAPIVLTRYLYIKDDVWSSLLMAILTKDIDQTLFWTCEMYHSGFEEELAEYLVVTYVEFFKAKNPRLEKYINGWSNQIFDGAHIAASMVRNLVSSPRLFTVKDFETTNDENIIDPESFRETRLIIHVKQQSIDKYNTIHTDDILKRPARKILQQACLYSTRKNMMELFHCNHQSVDIAQLFEFHRIDHHWVYFASFSPIWEKRIIDYNGTIDHETYRVDFSDDDSLEEFYEEYGYEPDEQCREVSEKFMHITPEPQITMKAFCCMFNKTKTIRVKKKRS
jgi:hypothetical protein